MPLPTRATEFDGDLSEFLHRYRYQPKLTSKLDDLREANLTPELLNEIVLWKINRYVSSDNEQLRRMDALLKLKPREHEEARSLVEALLAVRGVDLPMASAFLRFRNSAVFQIIDRHAYRAVYGAAYPLYTQSAAKRKIDLYFGYLDDLHSLCARKGLVFETVDRLLYEFDKEVNGSLPKGKSTST
jgi:thermostable 8-oxoguanine DNA glycosylase